MDTKLYIPPRRPNAVLRPRLVRLLDVDLRHKLTLISAPAGYGSTTLFSRKSMLLSSLGAVFCLLCNDTRIVFPTQLCQDHEHQYGFQPVSQPF
jgi:ATP/maltotriose-dependent transcriptional regulator MalT